MKSDKNRNIVKDELNWASAIIDAKEIIREYEAAIAGLRDSIRVFQLRRDGGEPWPGSTSNAEIGRRQRSSPRKS